jgi:16S rRNA (cytosine1402-N4)-methyltransferase
LVIEHVPALLQETLHYLAPERGGVFIDCTLGLGGHARALLESDPAVTVIGIDRDPEALRRAESRLAAFGDRVQVLEGRFGELAALLATHGVTQVDGVLADLGVSSLQLDRAERGFSFRFEGPLDMRMGGSDMTAADVIATYSEEDLARVFREHGEERDARRVARAIVRRREQAPIETTTELRRIIQAAKRGRRRREGRVDPATRIFQALRIEVNQELAEIDQLLDQAIQLLRPGGRLVVLSYHSLEDRIVKNRLRDLARGEVDPITGRPREETRLIEVLTRRPIRPRAEEVAANPRARSARLRAARRI